MKLKTLALYIILCMAVVISGCGGSSDTSSSGVDDQKQAASSKKSDGQSSSGFKTISDYADAWNEVYNQNEAAINKHEEPIMELVTPGLDFVTGVQYDLLNMENKDGRFEGELMMEIGRAHV